MALPLPLRDTVRVFRLVDGAIDAPRTVRGLLTPLANYQITAVAPETTHEFYTTAAADIRINDRCEHTDGATVNTYFVTYVDRHRQVIPHQRVYLRRPGS